MSYTITSIIKNITISMKFSSLTSIILAIFLYFIKNIILSILTYINRKVYILFGLP